MRTIWVGGPPNRGEIPQPRPYRALRPAIEDERMLTTDEREWLDVFVEPAERDVWLDAGLGPHDAALARACIDAGLAPHELSRIVAGRTLVNRLRNGEPAHLLAERIRFRRVATAG